MHGYERVKFPIRWQVFASSVPPVFVWSPRQECCSRAMEDPALSSHVNTNPWVAQSSAEDHSLGTHTEEWGWTTASHRWKALMLQILNELQTQGTLVMSLWGNTEIAMNTKSCTLKAAQPLSWGRNVMLFPGQVCVCCLSEAGTPWKLQHWKYNLRHRCSHPCLH